MQMSVISKSKHPTIQIGTDAGTLIAYADDSGESKSISLVLRPKGETCEIDLAFAEVKGKELASIDNDGVTTEDVCLYTYADPYSEEYTQKSIIRRSDVLKAISEV